MFTVKIFLSFMRDIWLIQALKIFSHSSNIIFRFVIYLQLIFGLKWIGVYYVFKWIYSFYLSYPGFWYKVILDFGIKNDTLILLMCVKFVKLFQILKDDVVKVLHWICQQIWKTQQGPQDLKRSVFIPISKKGNAKECSHDHTIAFISYGSKAMLIILQARLQLYVNFHMFKLDLEKAEEPEIKLPTSIGSSKKQESSRKTSTSALLTMPTPLTVWITTNCKILLEMGIQDYLTCLLRNLYAGQEAKLELDMEQTDSK